MPLPPRDMSRVHASLNPGLADVHARYPLSRFVPVMAMLKLYKLSCDGLCLMNLLDESTWMTLACLDDAAADFCINRVLACTSFPVVDKAILNAALVHWASPYLVPLMVPVPPGPVTTSHAAARHYFNAHQMIPADVSAHHQVVSAHQSAYPAHNPYQDAAYYAAQAVHQAAYQAAYNAVTKRHTTAAPPPPPPPPPKVSSGSSSSGSDEDSTESPKTVVTKHRFHGSVLRVICALVRETKGKVSMDTFDAVAERIADLPASKACKAIREFAAQVRAAANANVTGVLCETLAKYENM